LWRKSKDSHHCRCVTATATARSCPNSVYRAYGWTSWAVPEVRKGTSISAGANLHYRPAMGKSITDNPELLLYTGAGCHVTVLGGIKLTGLDRLRVTPKITLTGKTERAYRHTLDLYNGIQCGQLAERLSEIPDRT